MKQFLEKHLKVYLHEAPKFIWIAWICFVIFLVTAIFRNYVDTAFLKRYGPNYIPYMLVINAILTFFVMGVIDRLGRKFTDYILLSAFLGLYGILVTVLFFTVKADLSISYPILYQLLYLLDSVLLVYLWNIAGDLFDARQGKRIFPLITAGQVLGTTVGSFLTQPLTVLLGGEDPVLLVFAGISLAIAVYMWRTGGGFLSRVAPKNPTVRGVVKTIGLAEVPRLMKEYPIVRYLIVTGLIPNILLPIFFFQFSVIANSTFHSEQSLISFLSVFRGTTTLITFVLLFFIGRMYSSIGLANSSIVQPVNFALLFGSLPLFFNIVVAAYGQFSTILIQRAIAGPVNKILYSIIPSDLQAWSRTFIRGSVLKVGMLTGSLTMIFLKPYLAPKSLSYIAFVLALYWLLETLSFRKHYTRILKQVIAEKQVDFEQIEAVRPFEGSGATPELGSATVANRVEESVEIPQRAAPAMDSEIALKLLDDANSLTRAEAAASFAQSKDMRAVRKLIQLLGDADDDVRQASIEALMGYGEIILPFLEVSLLEAPPRTKQAILEVIRLSGLTEFEIVPFLGKELAQAYWHLIAVRDLDRMEGMSVKMLKNHLLAANEEHLSLIFYALWVYHADMRLMYQALKSESASIAVELVENSIQKELSPYLIPLIEDIPLNEKIEEGRKLFPLVRKETPKRIITFLVESKDPITRMLALFVIAEQMPEYSFLPVVESRLSDDKPHVRDIADYALKRILHEDVTMPDIIDKINKLRTFTIFEGMGIRELHAISSVISVETFAPGEVLIKQGEENSSIYLIVAGQITIYEKYGTEEQKAKATVGEGAFLGELSLFTRMPPNATCVADLVTEAYVLRHHQFQEIMKVYPQIGINLCRFFTMKLRQVAY
jgi:hypothetical protein